MTLKIRIVHVFPRKRVSITNVSLVIRKELSYKVCVILKEKLVFQLFVHYVIHIKTFF